MVECEYLTQSEADKIEQEQNTGEFKKLMQQNIQENNEV